jgi:hypothetical protein
MVAMAVTVTAVAAVVTVAALADKITHRLIIAVRFYGKSIQILRSGGFCGKDNAFSSHYLDASKIRTSR